MIVYAKSNHSFWGLESMENGKHLGKIGVAIQEAS